MFEHKVMNVVGLCLASFLSVLYWLPNDFVYDDGVAIVQNDDVANTTRSLLKSISAIFRHDFWGQDMSDADSHKSYRPFITLFYHLHHRFIDMKNPALFMKVVNLIIHMINCSIMFGTLHGLMFECAPGVIALGIFLFAVHPIHTEVIYSAVGLCDVLCALLFVHTVRIYMLTAAAQYATRRLPGLGLISISLMSALCLLSKEIGVMVLPFCIVYDILRYTRFPTLMDDRERRKRFFYFWILVIPQIIRIMTLVAITLTLAFLRSYMSNFQLPTFTPQENPVAAHPSSFVRIFTSLYIHALNMWLLICPDWLSCDWSHGSLQLIETWTDYRIIFAIIFYICLIRAFIAGPSHVRIAIALLVVPFIPSSHIIPVGFVVADRVLYISSIGFCMLVSIGFHRILPKAPDFFKPGIMLLLLLFIIRSNHRSYDFTNNLNLFQSAVRVCPNNSKIYYNLAQVSATYGNYSASLHYGLKADKLNPNDVATLINIGNAHRHLGNAQDALQHHQKAVKLGPKRAMAWMNLGITYVENMMYDDALAAYKMADKLKPNNGKIIFNMGNLYLRIGNLSMAKEKFMQAVAIDPGSQRANVNLITFLSQHGTKDELLTAINNAKPYLFDNVPVLIAMANALYRIDYDFEELEIIYARILYHDYSNYKVHGVLALEYQRRNKSKLAIAHYTTARKINPTFQILDQQFKLFMKKSNVTI